MLIETQQSHWSPHAYLMTLIEQTATVLCLVSLALFAFNVDGSRISASLYPLVVVVLSTASPSGPISLAHSFDVRTFNPNEPTLAVLYGQLDRAALEHTH